MSCLHRTEFILKVEGIYRHFHRKGKIFDVDKQFFDNLYGCYFEKYYKGNNCNDLTRLSKENWTLHTFSQNRRNI